MKTLCINIDNGNEWEIAQAEFARVGLTVERFPAIVEDNRPLAFNKSVYGCMLLAKDDSTGLLLTEDDCTFEEYINFESNLKLEAWIYALPKDTLTCHFGANIMGIDTTNWKMPERVDGVIIRLWNCFQSHCTYYSQEAVNYIINNFPFVTDQYATEGCQIFDEWLRLHVLSQGRSYAVNPLIAYQRPRQTSIGTFWADYTGCHKQGNAWLKKNIK